MSCGICQGFLDCEYSTLFVDNKEFNWELCYLFISVQEGTKSSATNKMAYGWKGQFIWVEK